MKRSIRKITGDAWNWSPYWWGNKFIKRRFHKIVRRALLDNGSDT
jgi:hypothetical protein